MQRSRDEVRPSDDENLEYWLFIEFRLAQRHQARLEAATKRYPSSRRRPLEILAQGAEAKTEEALRALARIRDDGEIRRIGRTIL